MKKLFALFAVLMVAISASAENYILYTSSDGNVVNPNKEDVFGAKIVTNTYEDGQGKILFEGDVTSIGDEAFKSCGQLTSITIPNSVTEIGETPFLSCSRLESFSGKYASEDNCCLIFDGVLKAFARGRWKANYSYSIPNTVTAIGKSAFAYSKYLCSVEIPNSVTAIGDRAFDNCGDLKTIEIPNSVTAIGDYAFFWCEFLVSIGDLSSVTSIGDHAFYGCRNLPSVEFSNSLTVIKDAAFWTCESLTSIVIPGSVTSIGNSAFERCTGLTSVEIQNGVTAIGKFAFFRCAGLTSVEIPNSVKEIGDYAFALCDGLKSVKLPETEFSIGEELFNSCNNLESIYGYYASSDNRCLIVDGVLKAFAGAGLTSYQIPNSVTKIVKNSLSGCAGLTSIVLTSSLFEISNQAFKGCDNLNEIKSLAVTPPSIIEDSEGSGFGVKTLYVPENSVEAYKSADCWKNIPNIVGLTEEELEALDIKGIQNAECGIQTAFDLSGRKVGEDYKGIVIRGGKKILNK